MSRPSNDEVQPLLAASQPSGYSSTHTDAAAAAIEGQDVAPTTNAAPTKPTPLPKPQIAVLCLMRVTEPMTYTVIFPFVVQMLRSHLPDSIPENELGYYAGTVESAFALSQFLTIFFWARLSDRIGRKPVLLIGLCGSFISINAFGFAKTFPQMVMARMIAGLMNGNIAILKSVLAEIADGTNQAKAFSLIPLCFAVGNIIGNGLGGWLVGVGESQFLKDNPFWLPCGAASFFNLLAIITGAIFLKETNPSKVAKASRSTSNVEQQDREPPATIRSLLSSASIRQILGTQFCLNFLNACHAALLPLFCYTAISRGGLSLSSSDIGTVLATNGAFTILIQLFCFPYLERTLGGALPVYKRVTLALPFLWLCFPLAHLVAYLHPSVKLYPMGALILSILLKGVSNMSIVCSNLLVNNSAPTRASLATINSVSQMAGCLSRFIGPSASTSLFAWSISTRFLGGQLVWLVMWATSAATWLVTLRMKAPPKAAWRNKP